MKLGDLVTLKFEENSKPKVGIVVSNFKISRASPNTVWVVVHWSDIGQEYVLASDLEVLK